MTILELLILCDDAGILGPWRNGKDLVWVSVSSGQQVRRLERRLQRYKERLLPILRTVRQAGVVVDAEEFS